MALSEKAMACGLDIAGRPGGGAPIRAGFIGCGSHAFRNVYPALRFLPVDLVAVCDHNADRREPFAKLFGADRTYAEPDEMLAAERDLDAVLIVTDYDVRSRPQFPKLAVEVMRAGAHAWIEKPPAASVDEIDAMLAAERETGRFTMVGFKKCFTPAMRKVREIITREEFGAVRQVFVRYPQYMPAVEEKPDLRGNRALVGFLDHVVHPASVLQCLAGPVKTLHFVRDPAGGGFASLVFRSGAVGSIHFAHGQSGTSPLERVEVVGDGANVVVENGIRVTYYRPGARGDAGYGRETDFIGPDDAAPVVWEPEFSLGQLYNKGLFLLGYYDELAAFVEAVRANRRPGVANLDDAREVMKLYEAFMGPEAITIELP
jgi:predicted dehydrogenase